MLSFILVLVHLELRLVARRFWRDTILDVTPDVPTFHKIVEYGQSGKLVVEARLSNRRLQHQLKAA
jgi:hypothetical protein